MKTPKFDQQLLMVTNEFGYPLYIAPCKNLEIQITDKKEDPIKT